MKKVILTLIAILVVGLGLFFFGKFAFGHYFQKKAEVELEAQTAEEENYDDLMEDSSTEVKVKGKKAGKDKASKKGKKSKSAKNKKVVGKGKASKKGVTSADIIAKLGESSDYAVPEEMVKYYTSSSFDAQVEDLAAFLAKYPNHRVDMQFYTSCIEKRRKKTGFDDAVSYPLPTGSDMAIINEIVHRIRTIPGYCDMVSDGLANMMTELGEPLGTSIPALKAYHKAHNWGVKNGQKWQKLHARLVVMPMTDPNRAKVEEKADSLKFLRGIEPWVEYEEDAVHVQTNMNFDEWCSLVINIILAFDHTGVEVVDSSLNYHLPPECVGSDMTTKAIVNTQYQEVQKETFVFIAKNKNGGVGMRFGFNMKDGRFLRVLEHHRYVAAHTPKRTVTATPKPAPQPSRVTGSTSQPITAPAPAPSQEPNVVKKRTTVVSNNNNREVVRDTGGGGGGGTEIEIIIEEDEIEKPIPIPPKPPTEENKTTKDESEDPVYNGNADDVGGTKLPSDGDGEETSKPEKTDTTVFEGSEDSGSRTIVVDDTPSAEPEPASYQSTDSDDYSTGLEDGSVDDSGYTVDNQLDDSNNYVEQVDREEATPEGEADASFTMDDLPD
ncbi:hypothetical protein IJ096_03250 [Candidatus Saccharibacteria bacterium]|nr:hypothetical protein [Candidatus Saccharibacteria bacterium]